MVAALFTRSDTPYLALGLDCYDETRDARTFAGTEPVIAHPPCRLWGKLFRFASAHPSERQLAYFAVDVVRENGGVLEHPAGSKLWSACALPRPGAGFDLWGGWTFPIWQSWFGHRADKPTWLYICGCEPAHVPAFPLRLGLGSHVIETRKKGPDRRPAVSKAERERTPAYLAEWLYDLAASCRGIN